MNLDDGIDVSDDVLAAALALIDDVYGSAERTKSRSVYRLRREEKQQLVAQVTELEHWLHAIRCMRAGGDTKTRARAWGQVATRQRLQAEETERTNAQLRKAVADQRELANQVCTTVQHARHLLISSITPRTRFAQTLPVRTPLPHILVQSLDAVHNHVFSTRFDTSLEDQPDVIRWTSNGSVTQLNARLTGRYPFKMSPISSEMWKMLHEASSGETLGHLEDDANTGIFIVRVQKPFGRMEVQGSTVTRRTFLPDGSVLLALASLSTGTPTEGNVMTGLEMLEITWVRIAHAHRESIRSSVCVEIVNDVRVRADRRAPPPDAPSHLDRLRAFGHRISDEDSVRAKQALENRLLTASLTNA